ncbi:DUF7793 family protein [Rufibacter hautae]
MTISIKPGMASLFMSLLFKFKPSSIPMKSFTDDKEAKEWLKQFM